MCCACGKLPIATAEWIRYRPIHSFCNSARHVFGRQVTNEPLDRCQSEAALAANTEFKRTCKALICSAHLQLPACSSRARCAIMLCAALACMQCLMLAVRDTDERVTTATTKAKRATAPRHGHPTENNQRRGPLCFRIRHHSPQTAFYTGQEFIFNDNVRCSNFLSTRVALVYKCTQNNRDRGPRRALFAALMALTFCLWTSFAISAPSLVFISRLA